MSRAKIWLMASAATVLTLSCAASAQETTSYSYDELGRLKASIISGGPNSTRQIGTCFDAAGNRVRYDVGTTTPAPCPTPTPTPTASP